MTKFGVWTEKVLEYLQSLPSEVTVSSWAISEQLDIPHNMCQVILGDLVKDWHVVRKYKAFGETGGHSYRAARFKPQVETKEVNMTEEISYEDAKVAIKNLEDYLNGGCSIPNHSAARLAIKALDLAAGINPKETPEYWHDRARNLLEWNSWQALPAVETLNQYLAALKAWRSTGAADPAINPLGQLCSSSYLKFYDGETGERLAT